MAHRNAQLTVSGRLLLVERIAVQGWSVAQADTAQGISRTTAYTWWAHWRAEGPAGLLDCSCAPQARPRALAQGLVDAIVRVRRGQGVGAAPDRLGTGAASLDGLWRAAAARAQPPHRSRPDEAAADSLCPRAPGRVGAPR